MQHHSILQIYARKRNANEALTAKIIGIKVATYLYRGINAYFFQQDFIIYFVYTGGLTCLLSVIWKNTTMNN